MVRKREKYFHLDHIPFQTYESELLNYLEICCFSYNLFLIIRLRKERHKDIQYNTVLIKQKTKQK